MTTYHTQGLSDDVLNASAFDNENRKLCPSSKFRIWATIWTGSFQAFRKSENRPSEPYLQNQF